MKHSFSQMTSWLSLSQGAHRQLAIGASANFMIKVLWKLLNLVSVVLLARFLGVEGLGTYTFAFTVATFITTFGTASIKTLIVQKMASYVGLNNWSLARGLHRRAREIALASAALFSIFAGFATWHLVEPDKNELRLTILIAFLMVPLVSQIHLNSGTLQGLRHVILSELSMWIARPLFFLILLVMLHFAFQIEMSAPIAMVSQVVAVVVTLIVSTFLLWPRIPAAMKVATPAFEMRDWWLSSLPFLVIGVLQQVNLQAGILLLGTISGAESVGIYRPAAAIAAVIMFGADAIELTIRPTVAQRYATGRTGGFQRLSTYSAWAGFGVASFGAALALLFGDRILLVFGPGFVEGINALGILCAGRVFVAALGQPGAFLSMTGSQSTVMWSIAWASGVNILLNLALIPHFGVNGAAIAATSSLLVLNIHNMIAVRRKLSIDTTILGLRCRAGSAG